MEGGIRHRIHRFYMEKVHPMLAKVLAALKKEAHFLYGTTTLYKIVKRMGFMYHKRDKKRTLYKQPHIIAQRHNFLQKVRGYRREKRLIVYLDETWLNTHHIPEKTWGVFV